MECRFVVGGDQGISISEQRYFHQAVTGELPLGAALDRCAAE